MRFEYSRFVNEVGDCEELLPAGPVARPKFAVSAASSELCYPIRSLLMFHCDVIGRRSSRLAESPMPNHQRSNSCLIHSITAWSPVPTFEGVFSAIP